MPKCAAGIYTLWANLNQKSQFRAMVMETSWSYCYSYFVTVFAGSMHRLDEKLKFFPSPQCTAHSKSTGTVYSKVLHLGGQMGSPFPTTST